MFCTLVLYLKIQINIRFPFSCCYFSLFLVSCHRKLIPFSIVFMNIFFQLSSRSSATLKTIASESESDLSASQWSVGQVQTWLHEQGLGHCAPAIRAAEVDGAKLLSLSDGSLKIIGIEVKTIFKNWKRYMSIEHSMEF